MQRKEKAGPAEMEKEESTALTGFSVGLSGQPTKSGSLQEYIRPANMLTPTMPNTMKAKIHSRSTLHMSTAHACVRVRESVSVSVRESERE